MDRLYESVPEINKNFASNALPAKELFENKVNTMVETLLSIYIFGNKTQCYNHWCDELSAALTSVMEKASDKILEGISKVMEFIEKSPNLYKFFYSNTTMEAMLKKVERHEKGILKQRKIERHQEFLISAFIAIVSQANRHPKKAFTSDNIRNALAIYADLDDRYFKENPDVERPDYEFFSNK